MTKKDITYADAWNAQPDGRSQAELFEGIVKDIKKQYDGNISEPEAREAARNLIGFVKTILEINHRQANEAAGKNNNVAMQSAPHSKMMWTEEKVAEEFKNAVKILRHLPPEKFQGYASTWPDIKYSLQELKLQELSPIRVRPLPKEISDMERVLDWITWLEIDERKLVWGRASNLPWKVICRELNLGRTTAWKHWRTSLTKIALRLNRK